MDEYIYKIRKYLPLTFADEEANEFLKYLQESYIENLAKEKYQFSFIAFHMLYMTFVYKVKWFLKQKGNTDIDTALTNFKQQHRGSAFNTLFDLSQFQEKTSLEKLLLSLRFHTNDISICKNHVEIRNNCSHASGRIYYKKQSNIEHYIVEEIEFVKRIQNKTGSDLQTIFNNYIENNWIMPIQTGYIRSWIIENYLSEKDLEIIAGFELPLFEEKSDNKKTIYQKLLYLVFINEAQKHLEGDKNLFLERLPIFMTGLVEEIKVTKDGEEKTISTQEIIEEYLIPIITDLSGKEREEAEKILNFS